MPLVKQHNTWTQAAGKDLNNVGNGSTSSSNSEMENVNESQIAAVCEGWGQWGINQDTAWEVPSSPHLSPKEGSTWTSTITGTEIWENSVRHHVQSSINNDGTWGEEEDTTGLWTGVPQAGGAKSGPNYDDGTAVWGNPVQQGKISHWKDMPSAKQMPNCVIVGGDFKNGEYP